MRRRKIDKTDLPESEGPTDKDETDADGTDVEESVVVSYETRGVETRGVKESARKDERDSTDDALASEDRGDGFASLTLRRERWNEYNTC